MSQIDPVFAAQRRATYDFNVRQAALARRAQAAQGCWTLSALLLIHLAGAVVAWSRGAVDGLAFSGAGWAFGFGAGTALLAGTAAWLHWALLAMVHTEWADVRLLDPADRGEPRVSTSKRRLAHLSFLAALALALLSALALPIAAVLLARS